VLLGVKVRKIIFFFNYLIYFKTLNEIFPLGEITREEMLDENLKGRASMSKLNNPKTELFFKISLFVESITRRVSSFKVDILLDVDRILTICILIEFAF
jgi:hypothetical protein